MKRVEYHLTHGCYLIEVLKVTTNEIVFQTTKVSCQTQLYGNTLMRDESFGLNLQILPDNYFLHMVEYKIAKKISPFGVCIVLNMCKRAHILA